MRVRRYWAGKVLTISLLFAAAAAPAVAQHEAARYPAGHPMAGQPSQALGTDAAPSAAEPAAPSTAPLANSAQPPKPEFDMVVAVVKLGTPLYRELGDMCGAGFIRGLPLKNQLVTYVRTFKCHTKYGNLERELSEVYYRGTRYFLSRDDLHIVNPDETRRNDTLTDEQVAQVRETFEQDSKDLHAIGVKDAFEAVDKTKRDGLSILERSVYDESEHTEGTGFSVDVINTSNKTIKYVIFTVVGYNAVDDPVHDRLKRRTSMLLRGIGPIEPMESGSYSFDYVWHTDLVESARITQIKLEYKDGTSKVLASPEKRLLLPASAARALNAPEPP